MTTARGRGDRFKDRVVRASAHIFAGRGPPRRHHARSSKSAARLHPRRRGAIPDARACPPTRAGRRRARISRCSAMASAQISRRSCSPAQPSCWRLQTPDRAEGRVRMRAQGDDEPARRCRGPRRRRRRADRDRRQRPLHRALPPPFLRAAERERSVPAQPRLTRSDGRDRRPPPLDEQQYHLRNRRLAGPARDRDRLSRGRAWARREEAR